MNSLSEGYAPLIDFLPWSPPSVSHQSSRNVPPDNSLIVVRDTIRANGSCVLYTIASQYLLSGDENGRVLWLSSGRIGPLSVRRVFRSMGVGTAVAGGNDAGRGGGWRRDPPGQSSVTDVGRRGGRAVLGNATRLDCIQIPNELTKEILAVTRTHDIEFDVGCYLRRLMERIREWVCREPVGPSLIVLDDFTSLSSILGQGAGLGGAIAFKYLQALRFDILKSAATGSDLPVLAVRCSSHESRAEGQMGWIGSVPPSVPKPSAHWDDLLLLLADITFDCVGLPSGPSRAAHGRITVSRRKYGNVTSAGGDGGHSVLNYIASPDGGGGGV
eukprot:CAMPEP_0113315996 /NCGR_PEP_ID=MMETSP0010_2-20120614/11437_1 /TAXON_ID=216773 ORGANISM="Corethron hystrix, Strain 308" /NCGR_SAMPLE_ID=MMETSP0010_2 /ASSEMBLY_ACC=CAM_ASM_000155 /LENGTH=328 /DNA_ID=CAMNT_0000172601 /DNA_START=34 /DNA_END=1017 /DNA_ORIENTATION=- /assembly_acc=CAM_ASM_000155